MYNISGIICLYKIRKKNRCEMEDIGRNSSLQAACDTWIGRTTGYMYGLMQGVQQSVCEEDDS